MLAQFGPNSPIEEKRRAEFLELLKLFNSNRIDYNTRKWETIKVGQLTAAAFFAGGAAALAREAPLAFASPVFFALAGFFAGRTLMNLRRESQRLFIEEASMFKIAKLLELDIAIEPGKRWLGPSSNDENLLPPKWLSLQLISDSQGTDGTQKSRAPDRGVPLLKRAFRYSLGFEPISVPGRDQNDLEKWAENKVKVHKFVSSGYGLMCIVVAALGYLSAVASVGYLLWRLAHAAGYPDGAALRLP